MSKAIIAIMANLIITPEMIADAKAKHGEDKVKIAELPLDDAGTHILEVLVKVPDRRTIGEFEKWADKNPDKSKEILLNACLLSFLDQIKSDDTLFFTAVNAIADLIPIRKAVIKNC